MSLIRKGGPMTVKQISSQEAYELLQKELDSVYIDVRTVPEFLAGHPKDAVNIPVASPDPVRGMVLNEDFVKVVEGNFPKDKKIIVGCQAGPRSERAARLLEEAGYQDVSNMKGGFGGMRNQFGQVIAPGWSTLGLPVSRENGEAVGYESLLAKIK
jgi:rhodanese-related sulfurtransferase